MRGLAMGSRPALCETGLGTRITARSGLFDVRGLETLRASRDLELDATPSPGYGSRCPGRRSSGDLRLHHELPRQGCLRLFTVSPRRPWLPEAPAARDRQS